MGEAMPETIHELALRQIAALSVFGDFEGDALAAARWCRLLACLGLAGNVATLQKAIFEKRGIRL